MPVNTITSTKQFTGDGVQTTFPFTFPISADTDLVVKKRVTATGVTTTQTLTTHYTVTKSGSNFDDGGNVEMVAAPAATDTLIVTRATTQTQGTDLLYGGPHDSEAYEDMVDKLARQVQELQAQVDRCLKIPDTDAEGLDVELPSSVDRASQYIALDASGEVTVANTFTGASSATAYIQDLLDDADAPAACATLNTENYDLYVDSVADLELLKAGVAGTYPRVFIAHGTYTTSERLDLNNAGVQFIRGERADTKIVFDTNSGNFCLFGDDTIMESLTIQVTVAGASVSILVPNNTANNNARLRDVIVYCSGAGDGNHKSVNGFSNNTAAYIPALENVMVYDTLTGFLASNNLVNCEAHSCVGDGFSTCNRMVNCFSYGNTDDGFVSCTGMSSCTSDTNGGNGFDTCTRVSSCTSDNDTGNGFDACDQIAACYAFNGTAIGFNNCDGLAACYSNGNGSHGFSACNQLAGCNSNSDGDDGFSTCNRLSACYATGATNFSFDTCVAVSASVGGGAGEWNGASETDAGSCDNA